MIDSTSPLARRESPPQRRRGRLFPRNRCRTLSRFFAAATARGRRVLKAWARSPLGVTVFACAKKVTKKSTPCSCAGPCGAGPRPGLCARTLWRGDIVSPRPSTGHPWPVAPCAHTPSRRPLKGTRKSNINIKNNNKNSIKSAKSSLSPCGRGCPARGGRGVLSATNSANALIKRIAPLFPLSSPSLFSLPQGGSWVDVRGRAFPNVGAIRSTIRKPTTGNTLIRPCGAPSPGGRKEPRYGSASSDGRVLPGLRSMRFLRSGPKLSGYTGQSRQPP